MRELLAAAWLLYLFEYGRQQIAVAAAYVVFMRLLVRKATWYQDPNRPLSFQGMLDRFTDDIFVKLHRFTKGPPGHARVPCMDGSKPLAIDGQRLRVGRGGGMGVFFEVNEVGPVHQQRGPG
jgi:hypothetical protein